MPEKPPFEALDVWSPSLSVLPGLCLEEYCPQMPRRRGQQYEVGRDKCPGLSSEGTDHGYCGRTPGALEAVGTLGGGS